MNINELISQGKNITVSVTPADLKEFAMEVANIVVSELKEAEADKTKEEKRYKQKEAAAYLGKSIPTLWRWEKSGYLVPDGRAGETPYYLESTLKKLGRKEETL